MKITAIRIIVFLFLVGASRLSVAQTITPEMTDRYVEGLTSDLNQYMGHYISPLLKGLGYGFNNGWYNTARPHKSFGFDITFSANAAYVPTIDQIFTFVPDDYQVLDLTGDPAMNGDFPTIMGGTTTNEVRSYLSKNDPDPILGSLYVQGPILDGIMEDLPINSPAVPSPIIQAGVGIYKGTEIKVRWMPTINSDGLEYKYFGLGVMHSVSQWVPVLKEMKFLDISGFVGFTDIDLTYALDSGEVEGANQIATFGVKTLTYEIIASATASVITGYVGIGFDSFKSNLNLNGSYVVKIPGANDPITGEQITRTIEDPVAINANDGGFRATVGARLKLAIITLHGAYTFQGYNTLNVGIGFSFR